jgi:hypothetical protein
MTCGGLRPGFQMNAGESKPKSGNSSPRKLAAGEEG